MFIKKCSLFSVFVCINSIGVLSLHSNIFIKLLFVFLKVTFAFMCLTSGMARGCFGDGG